MPYASLAFFQDAPAGGGMSPLAIFVQFGLIFAIFYFLFIRPQRKEQQRHREMVSELKRGDRIVTNGGIIGTIVKADDTVLVVKTGETKVEVERGRVARRLGDGAELES